MKKKYIYITMGLRLATVLFLSATMHSALSQIVINEFSGANYSHFDADNLPSTNQYEDWVEFFNPSDTDIDLQGYFLSDDQNDHLKFEFPTGTIVPANGYLIVLLSGLWDTAPYQFGFLNASFKLRQSEGEDLTFSNPMEEIIESYSYSEWGANQTDHSYARSTDGGTDWKICLTPSPGQSNLGIFADDYAPDTELWPEAGYYNASVAVSMIADDGLDIRYTLDGTDPDSESTLYEGPIQISATAVVKARAFSPEEDILPGFVETNTYFIGDDFHTLPVVSISGPELSDGYWGNWTNPSKLTTLELFSDNGTLLSESHGDSDKHGNDSNAYSQRGFDYITQDQMGYDHHLTYNLFPATNRQEFQRLIFKAGGTDNASFSNGGVHFRDVLCHNLAFEAELALDGRRGTHCVVYINAEYWGIYTMQEKADDYDYLEYYHGQPEGYLDLLKTWGGTWAEYGNMSSWNNFQSAMATLDFCDPAQFAMLDNQMNLESLMDLFIINSFVEAAYMLNWSMTWWKGYHPNGDALKWRYVLWDLDESMGGNVASWPESPFISSMSPCEFIAYLGNDSDPHLGIFLNAMNNPEFEEAFVNRYLQLAETKFSCENMNAIIDSLEQQLLPEMERQFERWGGNSPAGWQENIQELRDMVSSKCGENLTDMINACWSIDEVGLYDLEVEVVGDGSVDVNGVVVNEDAGPYLIESYSCANPFELLAVNGESPFSFWEFVEGSPLVDLNAAEISFNLNENIHLIAHFGVVDDVSSVNRAVVQLYPNPSNNKLTIQSDKLLNRIVIYDLSGRELLTLNNIQALVTNIFIGNLASGSYIVNVNASEWIGRFTVQ